MASIAMNYYRNGFQFFLPQIYWGGSGPGYVETELPVLPYITALLYSVFGIHEWLGIIAPWLCGFGLVVVTYLFGAWFFNSLSGLFAGIFAAVSPALVDMSTGFWPDPPMVFVGTLGLFLLARWSRGSGDEYLIAGGATIALAILLKITAMYLGIPIAYLCISKFGRRWWRTSRVWLLAAIVLLPPFLWYLHAHDLFVQYRNTFGILSGGYMKFATPKMLLNAAFYKATAYRVFMYHLTPFAFCMCLMGVVISAQRFGTTRLLFVWLLSLLTYIIVAATGVWYGHYQYLLPLLPPLAIAAGAGTDSLLGYVKGSRWALHFPSFKVLAANALLFLFLASTTMGAYLYRHRDLWNYPLSEKKKRTGLQVAKITEPGSLIIVSDTQMDDMRPEESMTPPEVFYFSDRRGWYLSMAWLTPDLIDSLRHKGGRYFVVTGFCADTFAKSHADIMSYLSQRYRTVMKNEDGIVYDMLSVEGEKQSQ